MISVFCLSHWSYDWIIHISEQDEGADLRKLVMNKPLDLLTLRSHWNPQIEIPVSIWICGSGQHGNSWAGNKYFGVFIT